MDMNVEVVIEQAVIYSCILLWWYIFKYVIVFCMQPSCVTMMMAVCLCNQFPCVTPPVFFSVLPLVSTKFFFGGGGGHCQKLENAILNATLCQTSVLWSIIYRKTSEMASILRTKVLKE